MGMKENTINKEVLWSKNFILVTLVQSLLAMPIYMVGNTLSAYLTGNGMADSTAGTIVSLFFFCSMLMRPFTGVGANRINKKKLLMAAASLFIAGSLIAVSVRETWALIVSRVLYGASWSVCTTTAMAYVADISPRNRMGEAIGFFGITQIIAAALAPSLAISLYYRCGYHTILLVSAGIQAAALICLLFMKASGETKKPAKGARFSFSDIISKEALIPATVALLFVLINNVLNTFLVNYGEEQSVSGVSVFFIITSIAMFAARMLTSKLVDRCRYAVAVLPCGLCMIASLLSLFFLRSFFGVVLAGVFFGLSYGALLPFTQTACVKSCPPEKTGTGSSTYMFGTDIGSVLGGVIGGTVAGAVGYANMYLTAVIPAMAGIGIAFLYKEVKN